MTRIRVLMRAIKLLEHGFIPYDQQGQARDKRNNIVSIVHPDAIKFNATAAVSRAIFELTGDMRDKRDELWTATMQPFKDRYKQWSIMYEELAKLDKQQVLDLFNHQLNEWNK